MHVFVSVKHKILIRWFSLREILFKEFWVVRRFSVIKTIKAGVFRVE